ncbi:MAG: hypothetical protein ABH858_06050 [Candidatus Omnitrophota bacterium]
MIKVDLGEKIVQLVAGLKQDYSRDSLEGKQIVVLANLEAKTLRGVESEGMLLAAQSEGVISFLTPDREVKCGSIIR